MTACPQCGYSPVNTRACPVCVQVVATAYSSAYYNTCPDCGGPRAAHLPRCRTCTRRHTWQQTVGLTAPEPQPRPGQPAKEHHQ